MSQQNRRKVLRALGSAAGLTATSGVTAASNGSSLADLFDSREDAVPESEIEVTDTTVETGGSVSTTATQRTLRAETKQLVELMEKQSGLTAVTDVDFRIQVKTNDAEFNSYEPEISVIPFGGDKRAAAKNGGKPVRGNGLLFVYTVVEDGERVPVGQFGMTGKPVGSRKGNAKKRMIRSYAVDDGDPVLARTEVVDQQKQAQSAVGTQGLLICSSCTTLVGAVCTGGARVLGQYGCVAACSAAFGANFIAIFGCASICTTLFNAIAAVGCAAGGTVICE
ncbi:MAG: halocin C8-like domain-containing protein, partial [Halobaculum sp.]